MDVLFVERLFERSRTRDALGLALATAVGLGGGIRGCRCTCCSRRAATRSRAPPARAARRYPARSRSPGRRSQRHAPDGVHACPGSRSSHETLGVRGAREHDSPATISASRPSRRSSSRLMGPPERAQPKRPDELPLHLRELLRAELLRGGRRAAARLRSACSPAARGAARSRSRSSARSGSRSRCAARAAHALDPPARDQVVESQRLQVASALAVAVLSAFGLQALLDAPRRRGAGSRSRCSRCSAASSRSSAPTRSRTT